MMHSNLYHKTGGTCEKKDSLLIYYVPNLSKTMVLLNKNNISDTFKKYL